MTWLESPWNEVGLNVVYIAYNKKRDKLSLNINLF